MISGISQTITEEDLNKAVKMIQKAKKPYIFVGGGVVISGASEELKKFVKMVDAPVCDSLMGKGAFDGEDDLPEKILCTQECLECMEQKHPISVSVSVIF